MLARDDLLSLLAGWLSLGYSLWSFIPQGILLQRTKPRTGGPSFTLLLVWLVGDGGTIAGLFLGGGLFTQKLSAIWFAVSDIVLIFQLACFRGLVPGTQRWRERKEEEHGAVGALITRAPFAFNSRKADVQHDAELGKREESREVRQARRKRRERRARRDRRDGFVELAPGKDSKQKKARSKQELNVSVPRERWAGRIFGRYNNVTQSVCLVLISLIMLGVWLGVDWLHRETAEPVPLAKPPTEDGKITSTTHLLGYILGWIGTVMYSGPRVLQLIWTVKTRSTAGIEPWLFGCLLLQNITLMVSIISASRDPSFLYAQSPFISNLCFCIFGDLIFLYLHHRFKDNPAPPSAADRPWTDPSFFHEDELPYALHASARDETRRARLSQRRREYAQQAHAYAAAHDHIPPDVHRKEGDRLRRQEAELHGASRQLDARIAESKDRRRQRAHAEASASSGDEEEVEAAASARRAAEREGAQREWDGYMSRADSASRSGSEVSEDEDHRRLIAPKRGDSVVRSSSRSRR